MFAPVIQHRVVGRDKCYFLLYESKIAILSLREKIFLLEMGCLGEIYDTFK
jgi:hypothetical protein